jgi:hypothetical protein
MQLQHLACHQLTLSRDAAPDASAWPWYWYNS